MKKRLALFLDGTWNDPDDGTNVRALHDQVINGVVNGTEQVPYYRKGVGTDRFKKLIGGAVGAGLSENVLHGYNFLVEQYQDDDEIYVFGFSRGAYTARSIVGVIIKCGLLRRGTAMSSEEIYDRYRRGKEATPLYALELLDPAERAKLGEPEKRLMECSRRVGIKMVGVWDTVGALGVPWTEMPLIGRRNFYFHNTNLSVLIEHAYHAMGVDEHRGPYKPTLWTKFTPEKPDPKPGAAIAAALAAAARWPPQKVEQRWFIGAHSNVGGGYRDDALKRLPLAWLQEKADECGLKFAKKFEMTGDEYRTPPVDSYGKFMWGVYRIARLGKRFKRTIGEGRRPVLRGFSESIRETIDGSVFRRYQEFPGYRPTNLTDWAKKKGVNLDTQPGECVA